MNGLILTLVLGVFIIVGALIVFVTKNNKQFIQFSISMAFSVIIMLIIVDILPEAWEVVDLGSTIKNLLVIIGGAIVGFMILTLLDQFIPEHDDDKNFKHIGLVSSIALVIHNVVEGMAIYSLYVNDPKAGIMASIGIGLHNIPLGMVITSTFYHANKSKKKTSLIILLISLSTFLGGLIMYFFDVNAIMEIIEAISLTITLGMLVYISTRELLPKVIKNDYRKTTLAGLLTGIAILLTTLFI